MSFTVAGGQLLVPPLSSVLDEKKFDIGKAHVWLGMIGKYQRPTKWNKANKKGTKVTFDMIRTEEDAAKAFDELEIYIREVNRKHGTDIELQRPEEMEKINQDRVGEVE